MKKIARSFGYSITGLVHALHSERNLRCFILGHSALLLLGISFGIDLLSLLVITIIAGMFIVVELLNTAIERLADTLDDCEKTRLGGHDHLGIKQTKDVASAAALVMLTVYLACATLMTLPYIFYFFAQP